jgi:hypothetical protein
LRLPPSGRSRALAAELARAGLATSEAEVRWLDDPRGIRAALFERPRAIVRARRGPEPWDVYLVHTRSSPEGALLGVDGAYNLTRTSAVDEIELTAGGERAAWAIGGHGRYYRVEIADLRGERTPDGEDWTPLARVQREITNLQRTGQLRGVGRRSFKLDPAAHALALRFEGERLVAVADGHRIGIPTTREAPIEGERFVREEDREVARPGNLVTWAVDRARDVSFLGDERMQLTKAVVYRALDAVDRAVGGTRTPAAEVVAEMGQEVHGDVAARTDPETGWPPAPVVPLVTPAQDGEGRWYALDQDPFTRTTPGAPAPLVTTYVRVEAGRDDARVYIVAWDPRQVDLDAVAGTEEPQSATGETGNGMIPRKPEVLSRVVAAFNGAFQSTHGDFGMMVDGALLVPPKPYAATIARMADGAAGFGTWPEAPAVPADVVSFRQNLTPLVADGRFNPYRRDWWGGVPHGWEDETRTVRSGVCLSKDGFVAYFYGTKIDHQDLAHVMLAARCDYGIHLDMNQGHTGLELYRAGPASEMPPISGKLDGHWQTEGDVLGMPGWRFRGRRLVRNLQLMHFPRYIRRSARDYFYLTLHPILPGAAIAIAGRENGEGEWTVRDLPQHGWPPALAATALRPDLQRPETKVRLLRIDPSLVEPAKSADAPLVLAVTPPAANAAGSGVWMNGGRAIVSATPPGEHSVRLAVGDPAPAGPVAAAIGVDADGMIDYAEVATAPNPQTDAAVLAKALDALHCDSRVFLPVRLPFAIGGARDLSDHPMSLGGDALWLARSTPIRARRIFLDTPILGPEVWKPLQRQTRSWPKESESASPSTAAPPAPGGSAAER